MTKDLYTVRDIAEQLQVQEKAIRRLISTGELKASKVLNKWVVTAENLKAFIDTNATDQRVQDTQGCSDNTEN